MVCHDEALRAISCIFLDHFCFGRRRSGGRFRWTKYNYARRTVTSPFKSFSEACYATGEGSYFFDVDGVTLTTYVNGEGEVLVAGDILTVTTTYIVTEADTTVSN